METPAQISANIDLHEPLLVNALGHSSGVLIFATFLYLLLLDRRGRGSWPHRLSAVAAAIALLWNLAAMGVLVASRFSPEAAEFMAALAFSILSILPAVLLHTSLQPRFRYVWMAGYLVAALGVAMHVSELSDPHWREDSHRAALLISTIGYVILTLISAAGILRRRARSSPGTGTRLLGSMCLLLLAISFVHFDPARERHAWISELVLHHAGIPIALFVLLQNHRFLLLDAFLRFLANFLVAAALALGIVAIEARYHFMDSTVGDPLAQVLVIGSLSLVLVLFAGLRAVSQRWLTRAVFRRSDVEEAIGRIRETGLAMKDEHGYATEVAAHMARFVGAEEHTAVPASQEGEAAHADAPITQSGLGAPWAETTVPLRFSRGDTLNILLGRRRGGRRYLSEDLANLARMAGAAVEQIERYRDAEVQRLVSQAELRALQAQINPHFLFNVLNTLYGIIPKEAGSARRMVLNLADLFRYFLRSGEALIPLEEELRIVEAYLEIESLRLGGKLRTEVDVEEAARAMPIPVLSIQPLVENAVKHGIAPKPGGGALRLVIRTAPDGLHIAVVDTGIGFAAAGAQKNPRHAGMGLENVSRRLRLCYGEAASLSIESGEGGARVTLLLPVREAAMAGTADQRTL